VYLLVIDPLERDRQATQRMLVERGHVVTAVADAALATRALRQSTFDAVIVDSTLPGGVLAFLQTMRSQPRTMTVYLVVTSLKRAAGDMSAAFLAGADDFMQKPYGREELLGRVEGVCRVKRWAAAGAVMLTDLAGGASDANALRILSGTYELALAPQCSELVRLAAWKTLDQMALADLTHMFALPFALLDEQDIARWTAPVNGFASTLTLSLAREQVELRLTVETDALSARSLAARALEGEEEVDESMIHDLLGEVANTLAGAFSRAAAAEGMSFTAGLPVPASAASAPSTSAPVLSRWIGVAVGDIQLYVSCVARVRPNIRVRTGELREGMILANDLTNESGALLVRAGTRLTTSTVNRVQRMLAGHEIVEVAEAA
jgi:DNA-binding response OmpR family regulator/CheY-specific phosphatase CheX